MLSRQLVRAATRAGRSAPARTISTTAVLSKSDHTPSLGDIEPDQQETFNSRQKEFRAKLAEAQKQREASAYSHSFTKGNAKALGSLSTAPTSGSTTGNAAQAAEKEPPRKAGPLTNLIYGTKEGREMDAQIEASFSQLLSRGKYVHSIVFHEVKPECVEEYVKLVGEWYPRMASAPENKVHLVGSWRTEVGDCDTFVHIWEYQRYQGYHASLHSISQHPEYPAFERKLRSLIKSKRQSLMQEFSFWPTTPPRQLGGLFELRSYTLHPGNLLEWETHWRRGLKARREVMEGVGAWFVQIGDLNTVHHLWQFADLEERKIRREKSWGIQGWAETVHKTVPLIQEMKSRILIPMPWSPVA
ncbi:protein NipSnap 1 [Naviculisporaceae sp. PSN 640]